MQGLTILLILMVLEKNRHQRILVCWEMCVNFLVGGEILSLNQTSHVFGYSFLETFKRQMQAFWLHFQI